MLAGLSAFSSAARADQFTIVDLAWTDPKNSTTDSHYPTTPSASTPKNLKSPVDYSKGSMHFILDVKTKPSAAQTRFQICLEQDAGYICPETSPVYTKTGTVEWTSQVPNWYVGNAGLDWSKPIKSISLILKDQNYNKVGGDANYYPTDLHIQAFMLSAGATFMAPSTTPTTDAGTPGTTTHADAGAVSDAGPSTTGAGTGSDADASTSSAPGSATLDAGSSASGASTKDAGTKPSVDAAVTVAADGAVEEPSKSKSDGGCRTSRGNAQSAAWFFVGLAALVTGRRRRTLPR